MSGVQQVAKPAVGRRSMEGLGLNDKDDLLDPILWWTVALLHFCASHERRGLQDWLHNLEEPIGAGPYMYK